MSKHKVILPFYVQHISRSEIEVFTFLLNSNIIEMSIITSSPVVQGPDIACLPTLCPPITTGSVQDQMLQTMLSTDQLILCTIKHKSLAFTTLLQPLYLGGLELGEKFSLSAFENDKSTLHSSTSVKLLVPGDILKEE